MRKDYEAVVASTGPSIEVDKKRTEDAIKEIRRVYGGIEKYNGLWVVAGTLGGQDPKTSQRTRIYNRFLQEGISEDRIRIVEGEDTMDKVRHLISLSEEENIRNIGISTYLLHYLRYKEGLHFAKKEGISPKDLEFKLIWSPTTPLKRWHKDLVHGVLGLAGETFRLSRYGFEKSSPDNKPLKGITDPIKKWGSDSRGLE